jgi:hypothetical protein
MPTVLRSRVLSRAVAIIVAFASVACGGSPEPTPPATGETSSPLASPALVGTWARETRCEELVAALIDAGLENWVLEGVAGNGFVPGVRRPNQIEDPARPCDGAVPREHSHFFDRDGSFGSLDWNGNAVDDGTYELVGDDTLVISKEFPDVTFHYEIQGDTVTFEPVIPECSPDCFEAAWSISVAYPGKPWHRTTD